MKLIYDEESEKILISQIVNNEEIFDDVILRLSESSFFNTNFQKCFKMLKKIKNENGKIDQFSFISEFKNEGLNPDVLEQILGSSLSSANYEFYCNKILKCQKARNLKTLLANKVGEITEENADEIINEVLSQMTAINNIDTDFTEETQLERICKLVPMIEKMLTVPNYSLGYNTGLNCLDSAIGGIHNELIVITARSSMGKTALAQQMALCTAKKIKTTFIELEMSAENINLRNVAMLSNMRVNDIKYGIIKNDKHKIERVQASLEELAKGTIGQNYKIAIPRNRKLETIISYIKKDVRKNGTKIVFIDHIGLIKASSGYMAKWEEQSEISHALQQLQRELKIPIVLLAQRGRDSEGGKAKGDISTIRGSGSIEEDADVILIIEHARATDKSEQDKMGADAERIDTDIYISKNRNGNCGIAKCVFKPSFTKFYDVIGE